MNEFISAITSKKVESFRIHAKRPDGNIGLTAWYTSAEIENVKAEIIKAGHTILKIESAFI